ncbi:putative transcription factor interactor and regulator CCHC(Zn) family [Helianthus annuus]|nr:putative transcription factor interactor and regulator CCHC(Zn) family [Helianthus annuus]
MPFEEAIGRLKAYEERIKEQDETSDNDQSKVLLSKTDGLEKNEETGCKCCGRGWSSQSDRGRGRGRGQGGRYQRDKRFIVCYNCQEKGHYASECPKKESKEEVANLAEEYDPSLF